VELTFNWIHPIWALGIPMAASLPIGLAMARALDPPPENAGRGLDAVPIALGRLLGLRVPRSMDWKDYALTLLAFNAALFVLAFGLLYAQPYLVPNPDGKGSLAAIGYQDSSGTDHPAADPGVVFNTVCSFVTNTNLQHYSGEKHLSYFSQLAGIVWLQFVTPAVGLCAMLAVVRGLRGDPHLGDFYVDLMRSLLFVFLPLAAVVALLLIAAGTPMTLDAAAQASTLDGEATQTATQTIARGPVAALVSIKQLGTNGGGYFGANSTHPYENPGPWTNLLELVSIIILPMSSIVMFGRMLRDRAHATVVYGVMLAFLVAAVAVGVLAESQPATASAGLPVAQGPNLEGKELRLGPVSAATWAAITTATSNGSVNSMHDSLTPLGGLVPMANMMLNVVFSGIGAGFLNILSYIIIAVFIAGLMVGRTPEYLGKKVEAKEVKLAMLAVLLHPLLICGGTALFAATGWKSFCANPGPHGFSEILYEFTSAAANNGSGFEGLSDNNPPWNVATGIVLLLGRFPALIFPLAIAGSLSRKKRVPQTVGTLRTDNWTFAGMLLGTVLLVGALSFMPALVLGPIADHLTIVKP
jgi:K+-transporting ATPase ATPase A chain